MIEKVNPSHPDKVADRIAGAIVDLCYTKSDAPKVAVEVLLGHGRCFIIAETSEVLTEKEVQAIVDRLAPGLRLDLTAVKQDAHLAENQRGAVRCGDNGIFLAVPLTEEEKCLSSIARRIYTHYGTDGKYILDGGRLIICQSCADDGWLEKEFPDAEINPLGYWTGGPGVDSGATNRKLGSDMGHSVTGGGLHGKDLSKADVSVNIYAFLKARETGKPVELSCAIGDDRVGGVPYAEIVRLAGEYIRSLGGFEQLAAWGLF